MKITKLTPTSPTQRAAKTYLEDGTSLPARLDLDFTAQVARFKSLKEFAQLLGEATPGTSFLYGIPKRSDLPKTFTISPMSRVGELPDQIARTRSNFRYDDGPGILFLDVDEETLRVETLLNKVWKAIPELRGYDHVVQPSSSAYITDQSGKRVSGLSGLHIYFMVESAKDIPELGNILFHKLALAGYASFKINKAGGFMRRGPIDATVWQPERLDYVGGAILPAGWTQERKATYYSGSEGKVVPAKAFGKLTAANYKEIEAIYAELNVKSLPKQDAANKKWVSSGKSPEERKARHLYKTLDTLSLDFVITLKDETSVTVGDIFSDRDKYNGNWCYDPIEGTNKNVCARIKFQTNDSFTIESYAHGGITYKAELESVWTNWVYVTSEDSFVNVSRRERISAKAFDRSMSKYVVKKGSSKPNASTFFLDYLNGKEVYRIGDMYRPDITQKFFEYGGQHYINTYEFTPPTDEGADVSIIEKHIRMLFPNKAEADQLIMWLAYNVKNPGSKINWVPLLIGSEGDGKTTILNILRAAMGVEHVSEVSNESLSSSFSSWAGDYAVVAFEEIRIAGQNRTTVMNRLKAPIANKTVEVIRKGKDPVVIPNVTNYIAMTNHDDALKLTESSNRWFIIQTPFKDKSEAVAAGLNSTHFDEVYDVIGNNPGSVRRWFLNVDTSTFRPLDRMPFKTAAFEKMFTLSKSDAEASIQEILDLGGMNIGKYAISTKHINLALKDQLQQTINTNVMSKTLVQMGWVRYNGKVKVGDEPLTIYVRPGYENATTEQLRDALKNEETAPKESYFDAPEKGFSKNKEEKKKLFNT